MDVYKGTVIKGLQNGRKFGFPTANLELEKGEGIPSPGVYAVIVDIEGQHFNGMLYVGIRPTLHLSEVSVEINIFDFVEDIYGQLISFSIMKKIREEIKFDSTKQLIAQIKQDKEDILQYFSH